MSTSKEWYDMVHEFHFKFGHPVSPIPGDIIDQKRRAIRGKWMIEKLMMVIDSWESTEQVGNILDFLYYCWGNFVETGTEPEDLDCEFSEDPDKMCPDTMRFKHRVSFASRAASSVFEFIHSDTRSGQRDFSADAARIMLRALKVIGVDPRGLMEIVHDSNMGKLWPDGSPKYSTDGKIMKPITYESPEPRIDKMLVLRTKEYIKTHGEHDDVPF